MRSYKITFTYMRNVYAYTKIHNSWRLLALFLIVFYYKKPERISYQILSRYIHGMTQCIITFLLFDNNIMYITVLHCVTCRKTHDALLQYKI